MTRSFLRCTASPTEWTMPTSSFWPMAASVELADNSREVKIVDDAKCAAWQPPATVYSSDPDVLRAALIRESTERRRAECRADMQTEIAKLAHDLLVREPDIDGFFGALTKEMVDASESHTCGVWLLD